MVKDEKPKIVSKFAGEAFGLDNVRTVFASASEDNVKREDRVIVLIGPAGTGKSTLIDCFCNYFYGTDVSDKTRYKIADEIFDNSTPIKAIIKYVFNETKLPYRPVVIDTPGIGSASGVETDKEISAMLASFLSQSRQVYIHAIGFVLKYDDNRVSLERERQIKETLAMFPKWMMPNVVPLLSSSERKGAVPPAIRILFKHLELSENKCFFFNSGSLFDMSEADALSLQLRKTYWTLTMAELKSFFVHVGNLNPQCIAEELPPTLNGNGKPMVMPPDTTGQHKKGSPDRRSPVITKLHPRESPIPAHIDAEALKGLLRPPSSYVEGKKVTLDDKYNTETESSVQTKSLPYSQFEISTDRLASMTLPNFTSPNVPTSPQSLEYGFGQSSAASTSQTRYFPAPGSAQVQSADFGEQRRTTATTSTTTRETKHEERVVPIRIVDQNQRWSLVESPTPKTPDYRKYSRESLPEQQLETTINGSEVIKRYIYDPVSMTHKEYLVNIPKRSSSRISSSSAAIPKVHAGQPPQRPHYFTETVIDDVPSENLSKSPSEPEAELRYTHVKSSPPPAYTPHSQKPLATLATADSPAKDQTPAATADAADSANTQARFSRSAVQRQIVKRSPSKGDSPVDAPAMTEPSPTVNARSSWTYRAGSGKEVRKTSRQLESAEKEGKESETTPLSNASSLKKKPQSPLRIRPSVLRRAFESTETETRIDDTVEQPRLLETNFDGLAPTSFHDPLEGASSRHQVSVLRDDDKSRSAANARIPVLEQVGTQRGAPVERPSNLIKPVSMVKPVAQPRAQYDLPPAEGAAPADTAVMNGVVETATFGSYNVRKYELMKGRETQPLNYPQRQEEVHFMESGYPQKLQDRAVLLSPMVPPSPTSKRVKAGKPAAETTDTPPATSSESLRPSEGSQPANVCNGSGGLAHWGVQQPQVPPQQRTNNLRSSSKSSSVFSL